MKIKSFNCPFCNAKCRKAELPNDWQCDYHGAVIVYFEQTSSDGQDLLFTTFNVPFGDKRFLIQFQPTMQPPFSILRKVTSYGSEVVFQSDEEVIFTPEAAVNKLRTYMILM
jgi:hypothetical protein